MVTNQFHLSKGIGNLHKGVQFRLNAYLFRIVAYL